MSEDEQQKFNNAFDTANAFRLAAKRCNIPKSPIDGKIEVLMIPSIINAAFSCEVFLKAMLIYQRKPVEKIHKICELFSKLDNKSQENIIKEMNVSEQMMSTFLGSANEAFNQWRYLYENPKQFMQVDLNQLCKLADVLFKIEKDYKK